MNPASTSFRSCLPMVREVSPRTLACGGYFFGAGAGAGAGAAGAAGGLAAFSAAGAAGGGGGGASGFFCSAQAERPNVAANNSAMNSVQYLRISCHSFPFWDLSVCRI